MSGNKKKELEETVKRVVEEALQNKSLLQVFAATVRDLLMADLQQTIAEQTSAIEALKKVVEEKDKALEALQNKVDDLEQYQRRQCLRVFGVAEEDGEDTDQKAILIASQLGVDLTTADIDRSHRIGRKTDKPRPIIVKFVSYRKRSEVFRNKKHLKGSGVTVREDLTKTRYRLLQDAIGKYGVKNVWTVDGTVIAKVGEEKRRITCVRDLS